VTCASIYIVIFALLVVNQRSLIFIGSASHYSPETQIQPIKFSSVLHLQTPRLHDEIPALLAYALLPTGLRDPDERKRPTILFFYGNGGNINTYSEIIDNLRSHDVNVLVPEYPGYGFASGKASDQGCYDAADAAYTFARKNQSPESAIIAAGWSLGSGVAIHLADSRPVKGLAIFSAYTSMADMASNQYPIFPGSLLRVALLFPFPSEATLRKVHCPVFIAHGTDDSVIPYSMFKRMKAAPGGPVTACSVPGAGHGVLTTEGDGKVYRSLSIWLASICSRHNPHDYR
jgi:pimeloyl-ACP methyl ester carboxylesterase